MRTLGPGLERPGLARAKQRPGGRGAGLSFPSRRRAGYPTDGQGLSGGRQDRPGCDVWWYCKLAPCPMGADLAGRQGTIVIKPPGRGEKGPLSTMGPISIW